MVKARVIRGSAAALLALVLGTLTAAEAAAFTVSYGYTLSGNGRMEWSRTTNELRGIDYKSGDHIYIRYAFTSAVCGTQANACEPTNGYSTFRLSSPNANYSQTINTGQSGPLILLKLCNDDAPPDTCSEWKRANA